MREIITWLAEIVNTGHDILIVLFRELGFSLTDKQLHFWIIGFIGIFAYFFVYFFFKLLAAFKWSTSIFSFVYTFTLMIVLVFAIEIQQAITNRGNMEFADAVIGLWGFLVFFFVYASLAIIAYLITKWYKKRKH
ncbi:hypothetical protein [Paraliobacillus zengyii]|uniref:hypothetical protein n=1 Tax=Paraliobacillus zengyii TaxID=2213194 RepID=UPI000DD4CB4C|nr:hypothetical protein [Paraliobacillus zengyii]